MEKKNECEIHFWREKSRVGIYFILGRGFGHFFYTDNIMLPPKIKWPSQKNTKIEVSFSSSRLERKDGES
jgi:hypothetical protein